MSAIVNDQVEKPVGRRVGGEALEKANVRLVAHKDLGAGRLVLVPFRAQGVGLDKV